MARKFKELRDALDAKLTPEQRAAHKTWVEKELEKIRLNTFRRQRNLTQASLAARLGVDQGSISRLEKQTDMHLSTLRDYVQAAGGHLELRAVFPTESFNLTLSE